MVACLTMPVPGSAQSEAPGASYYDDIYAKAPSYAEHWKKSTYVRVWQKIADVLREHKIRSVLEVGCGPGQLAACMKELVPDLSYSGFDFSPQAILMAKKARPDGDFVVADIRDAQSYAGDYQAVIATEVFEHLDDDIVCLRKIPEGKLVIFSVPNFDDPGHVRYFQTDDDVLGWYAGELKDATVVWVPRNAQYGYWIGVGRR